MIADNPKCWGKPTQPIEGKGDEWFYDRQVKVTHRWVYDRMADKWVKVPINARD